MSLGIDYLLWLGGSYNTNDMSPDLDIHLVAENLTLGYTMGDLEHRTLDAVRISVSQLGNHSSFSFSSLCPSGSRSLGDPR